MCDYKCPACGADMKDWRAFIAKHGPSCPEEAEKPFECVGFRCGKRWKTEEILQNREVENGN